MLPHTRRPMCPTSCPRLLGADWCSQSNSVPDSGLLQPGQEGRDAGGRTDPPGQVHGVPAARRPDDRGLALLFQELQAQGATTAHGVRQRTTSFCFCFWGFRASTPPPARAHTHTPRDVLTLPSCPCFLDADRCWQATYRAATMPCIVPDAKGPPATQGSGTPRSGHPDDPPYGLACDSPYAFDPLHGL